MNPASSEPDPRATRQTDPAHAGQSPRSRRAAGQQQASMRRPFDVLARRIVAGVAERYLDDVARGGQAVEIASGAGQLRRWLPAPLRRSVTHAEASSDAARRLAEHFPNTKVEHADAHALPCGDASQRAVLALCALDGHARQGEVRDEVRRVLAPGGLFVHFQDMPTRLEAVIQSLVAEDFMPLPNFFNDDAAINQLDAATQAELPHPDAQDDLLVVDRSAFQAVVDVFVEAGHSLGQTLGPYARLFVEEHLEAGEAARALSTIISRRVDLQALNKALLAVYLAVNHTDGEDDEGLALDLESIASWRWFQDALEQLFQPDEGFDIVLSDVVSARHVLPKGETVAPDCVKHTRCVGRDIERISVVDQPVGLPVESLEEESRVVLGSIAPMPDDQFVQELGMYVFIARRAH